MLNTPKHHEGNTYDAQHTSNTRPTRAFDDLTTGDFILLRLSLVDRFDGDYYAAAIVQRVFWKCEHTGSWAATYEDLSQQTRLSVKVIRSRVKTLREDGWLVAERSATWDSTLVYRLGPRWFEWDQEGGSPRFGHPDMSPGDTSHMSPGDTSHMSPGDTPSLETVETTTRKSSPASPPSKRRASKPLPDDWAPSPAHEVKAGERRVDVTFEAEKFRNHAEATDRRCVNWDAAFRNWLLKATPRPASPWDVPPRAPAPPVGDPGDYVKEREAIIAREQAAAAAYEEANRGRFADVLRGPR